MAIAPGGGADHQEPLFEGFDHTSNMTRCSSSADIKSEFTEELSLGTELGTESTKHTNGAIYDLGRFGFRPKKVVSPYLLQTAIKRYDASRGKCGERNLVFVSQKNEIPKEWNAQRNE